MAERKLQKVEDELNCRICMDTYTDPKLLQCFHVYCRGCLSRLVVRQEGLQGEQGELVLPCPECRQETSVPANGVAGLKSAFYINRLLDIMGEAEDKDEEAEREVQPKRCCSEHATEELKLYCETCGKTICWKCAYEGGEHATHDHEVIEEAFKTYQEEINSLQKLIKEKMMKVTKGLRQIETYRVRIKDQCVKMNTDIQGDARQIQLTSQLVRLTEIKLKSLSMQEEKLKTTQIQLKSLFDFLKYCMTTNCHLDSLETKTSVMKQIAELTVPLQSKSYTQFAETAHYKGKCTGYAVGIIILHACYF